MDKTSRLLRLMQVLRGRQTSITARELAERLSVSVRTVYRDVQALVALGAAIEGSAGVGYLLRSGFFLPPLMFSDDEIEALVLGARWVEGQGDAGLAGAAESALSKIASGSPAQLRERIAEIGLWAPGLGPPLSPAPDLGTLRLAIRQEHRVRIRYTDAAASASERTIWPIALGFFEGSRVVAAWCELRSDFRHFRVDRIAGLQPLDERYPATRRALVKSWKQSHRQAQAAQQRARDC
jgi:predicted DNA-binding transcriptional regulator YafY